MKRILCFSIAVIMLLCAFTVTASARSVSYTNPSSAYKDSVYYNSLMSVELTGDQRNDVIAIALSQLYYSEGNSLNDLNGLNKSGNNDFNEFSYNYGPLDQDGNGTREYNYPWCAAFVTFCLRRAEVSKSVAPSHVNCTGWLNKFKEASSNYSYHARGSYTPLRGDIIFFKSSSTSRASDHVGLVIGTRDGYVYTIEGNTSGGVYTRTYSMTDTYIVGYAVPKYSTSVKSATVAGDHVVTAETALNMRTGPSTSYTIIKSLPHGTRLEVISSSGGWIMVRAEGSEGWVSASYTAPIECTSVTVKISGDGAYKIYAGYGCAVELKKLSLDGFVFEGYSTPNGNLVSDTVTSFTADTTLTPVFTRVVESTTPPTTTAPESEPMPPQSDTSAESTDGTTPDTTPKVPSSDGLENDAGCSSFISIAPVISLVIASVFLVLKKNRP